MDFEFNDFVDGDGGAELEEEKYGMFDWDPHENDPVIDEEDLGWNDEIPF